MHFSIKQAAGRIPTPESIHNVCQPGISFLVVWDWRHMPQPTSAGIWEQTAPLVCHLCLAWLCPSFTNQTGIHFSYAKALFGIGMPASIHPQSECWHASLNGQLKHTQPQPILSICVWPEFHQHWLLTATKLHAPMLNG